MFREWQIVRLGTKSERSGIGNVEKSQRQISVRSTNIWSIPFDNVSLDSRLGITVEPSQVRLKTNDDDPYTWEKTEAISHLFIKNLSEFSIKALQKLCECIDDNCVAATWKPSIKASQTGLIGNIQVDICVVDAFYPGYQADLIYEKQGHFVKLDVSFTAKINELKKAEESLARELNEQKA